MGKGNDPRRHHYLAQGYLRGFSYETKKPFRLWVFDRELGKPRPGTPINEANQHDYYAFEDSAGDRSTEIEDLLSRVDGAGVTAIRKLRLREELLPKDREGLAFFTASLCTRTPEFHEFTRESTEALATDLVRLLARQPGRLERLTVDVKDPAPVRDRDALLKGEIRAEITRPHVLPSMLQLGAELAATFLNQKWVFVYAPEKTSFITTDNPVVGIWPQTAGHPPGFASTEVQKLIPLAQDLLLIVHGEGAEVTAGTATRDQMTEANLAIARRSLRFLYARDETLLRSVVARAGVVTLETRRRIRPSR